MFLMMLIIEITMTHDIRHNQGHFCPTHKTLSRPALRSFCSLKTYFFLEEGVSTIMVQPEVH
jgi:hypothetical protein